MIWLKEIAISNFQSHGSTVLSLDPGMNVIVGPSDSGKTAIIRAIRWVLYNEPQGDQYVKNGEDHTWVQLTFSNGLIVKRARIKTKNSYDITYEGQSTHYEGFGNTVPPQIQELTHIERVKIHKNTEKALNLSSQLEQPFLLTESPLIKAEALGVLNVANEIDEASTKLRGDRKEADREITRIEKEREEKKELLARFDYLQEEKKQLDRTETILKEIENKKNKIDQWTQYQKDWQNLTSESEKFQKILRQTENTAALITIWEKLVEKDRRLGLYRELRAEYFKILDQVAHTGRILKRTEQLDRALEKTVEIAYRLELYKKWSKLRDDFIKNKAERQKIRVIDPNITRKLQVLQTQIENKVELYRHFLQLKNQYSEISERIRLGEKYLFRYSELAELKEKKDRLEQLQSRYLRLIDFAEKKRQIEKEWRIAQKDIDEQKKALRKKLLLYSDKLKALNKCPLCQSEMTPEHLNEIMEEMRKTYGI